MENLLPKSPLFTGCYPKPSVRPHRQTIAMDARPSYDDDGNETHTDYWAVVWIEGVGYNVGTPTHYAYALGSIHSLDPDEVIICAYKNGEQVYMSDFAEIHGCDYYLQDDTHEAIYNVPVSQSSASKLLREGQLIIEKNDKFYNAQGVLIK